MSVTPPIRTGMILFDGFEQLDVFGPLEMFGLLGQDATISVVAEEPGCIQSSGGPRVCADVAMKEATGYDVLLVPGGIGTRSKVDDSTFVAELKRLAEASSIVATICTGSYLLASTGILDGHRATSNKRAFRMVAASAPNVDWVAKARWIEDGKYFTSSGVSAGMDMTLALIARLCGREKSLQVARSAEYEWHEDSHWDPFAADLD